MIAFRLVKLWLLYELRMPTFNKDTINWQERIFELKLYKN